MLLTVSSISIGQIPAKVPKLSQDLSQASILEELSAILQLLKLLHSPLHPPLPALQLKLVCVIERIHDQPQL